MTLDSNNTCIHKINQIPFSLLKYTFRIHITAFLKGRGALEVRGGVGQLPKNPLPIKVKEMNELKGKSNSPTSLGYCV